MRARLIAILILVILIGGPVWMYWYFIASNTSSILLKSPNNIPFHVEISGKFNYTYLPLADKIIKQSYDCQNDCKIGPLAPALYDLVFTSTGYESQTRQRTIERGESISEAIDFYPELKITPIKKNATGSILEDQAIIDNIQSKNSIDSIRRIIRKGDKLYVEVIYENVRSIGVIRNDSYNQIYEVKDTKENGYLDTSENVFIIPNNSTDILIFLDTREVQIIPHFGDIFIVRKDDTGIVVRTPEGSLTEINGKYQQNPRYTDWIDINERYRLGYIDESDKGKLTLQNYPIGTGILVLLDRSTGLSRILRTPFDMLGFIYIEDDIGFIDKSRNTFVIENITPQ